MNSNEWMLLALGQVAAEKKRKAEEAKQREQAERVRKEAEEAVDRAAAKQRAFELRESVHYHRQGVAARLSAVAKHEPSHKSNKTQGHNLEDGLFCITGGAYVRNILQQWLTMHAGAVSKLERLDGQVAWYTEPAELLPGRKAKLFYNAQAGPLAFMAPLPSAPSVILGHNGWLDSQVSFLTCTERLSLVNNTIQCMPADQPSRAFSAVLQPPKAESRGYTCLNG